MWRKTRFYRDYVEIRCPKGCGKIIKGLSKSHWLHNFGMHLTGKKHRIMNMDERKRIVEEVRKNVIEKL